MVKKKFRSSILTDVGKRLCNQDEANRKGRVFVVCDGVGSRKGSHLAAKLTSTVLCKLVHKATLNPSSLKAQILAQAIEDTNKRVYEVACNNPKFNGMATTMACLVLDDNGNATIGHVGDCCVIFFNAKGKLIKLTKDHCLETNGKISNIVTRIIGSSKVTPDITTNKGKGTYLVVTDGFSRYASYDKIKSILREHLSPKEKCKKLIEEAKNGGSKDNITVCIVEID